MEIMKILISNGVINVCTANLISEKDWEDLIHNMGARAHVKYYVRQHEEMLTLTDKERLLIQSIFGNVYLFQRILIERDKIRSTGAFIESVAKPLHRLIIEGDRELLRYSIHKYNHAALFSGHIMTPTDEGPLQPVDTAINIDDLPLAKYLHEILPSFGRQTEQSLILASARKDRALSQDMLAFLIDVRHQKWGATTIEFVVENHYNDSLAYLLTRADTSTLGPTPWTFEDTLSSPLSIAIENENIEAIPILLQNCKLTPMAGYPGQVVGSQLVQYRAFQLAIRSKRIDVVEMVVQAGLFSPQHDTYHDTLYSAILSDSIDMIRYVEDRLHPTLFENDTCLQKALRSLPIVVSDEVLEYLATSTKCPFKFNEMDLNPYIIKGREDAIKLLLNNKMAEPSYPQPV
ncbi:hypothetical protein DFA_02608 [Cavenderia fasciculata]|uniref:Ankyrin repeat-containing protein n=1 Tax=Cavenderia fasciculata TaxID=261658 RepID=F4PZV5_CACFS|nr:uncharacterized protein DFA_02608 [Cavenderia fasciculata]EGG18869.1 hypothetical protein DFA_02608 [Cavenderia fasciculata]|eukprot:XP_004357331.1 hypothetical protein DFA_02608 [Cavenderia fasciculata]